MDGLLDQTYVLTLIFVLRWPLDSLLIRNTTFKRRLLNSQATQETTPILLRTVRLLIETDTSTTLDQHLQFLAPPQLPVPAISRITTAKLPNNPGTLLVARVFSTALPRVYQLLCQSYDQWFVALLFLWQRQAPIIPRTSGYQAR